MRMLKLLFLVLLALILLCGNLIQAVTLSDNLKPLEPLLKGTWEGMFKTPDGSREFRITRSFTGIFDGNAVRCMKENIDMKNTGEGYLYWDDVRGIIAYFFIENKGVFLTGDVTVDNRVITIRGTMTWPNAQKPPVKQSYEFRNTFEITEEGTMIDRWFHNAFGEWRPGHEFVFHRVSAE